MVSVVQLTLIKQQFSWLVGMPTLKATRPTNKGESLKLYKNFYLKYNKAPLRFCL